MHRTTSPARAIERRRHSAFRRPAKVGANVSIVMCPGSGHGAQPAVGQHGARKAGVDAVQRGKQQRAAAADVHVRRVHEQGHRGSAVASTISVSPPSKRAPQSRFRANATRLGRCASRAFQPRWGALNAAPVYRASITW